MSVSRFASQGLKQLNLKIKDKNTTVQAIFFKADCPSILSYDYNLRAKNLPSLDLNEAPAHLIALLYESSESINEPSPLNSILIYQHKYKIAVFSEKNAGLQYLYLLSHSDDKENFGKYISTSKFAIFRYHLTEIFANNATNYTAFIKGIKANRAEFIQELNEKNKEELEKKEEEKNYVELVEFNHNRNNDLIEELKISKLAIEHLNFQIEKSAQVIRDKQGDELMCKICNLHLKNIAFLPCGHIVYCNLCFKLNKDSILLNAKKQNSIKTCLVCNTKITESMIVRYFT